MKALKIILKSILILIGVLLIVIILTPVFFKGKILDIAKEQVNKNVKAKVEFTDLGVSLIRNFPYLSVNMKNLSVAGIEEFEEDTLLQLKSFNVKVNAVSALKMDNIEIKGISITEPSIYAKKLENGMVNWDIAIEKEELEEEEDTTVSEFKANIELKKFEIVDANIYYVDDSSNMKASLEKFNFLLSGDLSQDRTIIKINSSTKLVNVLMSGIRYVKDASLNMNIALDADLKNSFYELKENEIALNGLVLEFDGSVSIPNDNDMDIQMNFNTQKTSFKSLLSLVPAIYMKDFEDIQTSGNLLLKGKVKGTMNESSMPNADLNLKVENAMFKYPALPKSADNIQIDVKVHYDGVVMDRTTVDVNKFHVDLGGNPVDISLHVKTPESDMNINGNLKTDINLVTLADVVPVEDATLTGIIKSDIKWDGYYSYIEKEEYNKFNANGNLSILNFEYNSPDLPKAVKINESNIDFSPAHVNVNKFDIEIGKSDINLKGRVENFIPYVLKDEIIKGEFHFTSSLLDLNELMVESAETEKPEELPDTLPLKIVEVPKNIDFKLNSNLEKIYYDKMEIDNTVGIIKIKNGVVYLENLSMNTMEGSVKVKGEYNTTDLNNPFVDFGLDMKNINVASAAKTVEVIEKFAPIVHSATGKVNVNMQYKSTIDENMKPILPSILGNGEFKADNLGILKSETFTKLGDKLNTKAFDKLELEKLDVDFEIKDGRVHVAPFKTKMGNTDLTVEGDQGIDKTMDYDMVVAVPKEVFGSAVNETMSSLFPGSSLDKKDKIDFDVQVGGTFTSPKISIIPKGGMKEAVTEVKEEVKEKVKEEVDKKKEEIKAKANAEAQKIIADAEKQAAKIRAEAKELADDVRAEAKINADRLVKSAKNPIAKKAAEVSGDKIKKEGEANAQKIEKEADDKANKLVQEAKERAAKLTK